MKFAHTVKTTFANNRHPLTGVNMSAKSKPTLAALESLEICDDPLPTHRTLPTGKYDTLLLTLKPGKAIKCKTDDVGKVAAALRKLIDNGKVKGAVRTMANYGDGMGRVWLVALPAKALKVAA